MRQQAWLTVAVVTLFLVVGLGEPTRSHAATLTVTTTADTDNRVCGASCSLREAITVANAGDTITFAAALVGQTITLTLGELVIDKDLTISGPGVNQLTISGNSVSRIFFINPGVLGATSGPPTGSPIVTIARLTVANGLAKGGDGAHAPACVGAGGAAAGMGGALF